jgi:hypothetical protein
MPQTTSASIQTNFRLVISANICHIFVIGQEMYFLFQIKMELHDCQKDFQVSCRFQYGYWIYESAASPKCNRANHGWYRPALFLIIIGLPRYPIGFLCILNTAILFHRWILCIFSYLILASNCCTSIYCWEEVLL